MSALLNFAKRFLLSLAFGISAIQCEWNRERTLLKPLGRTLIGYNNKHIFLFGGSTNTGSEGCSGNMCCENTIYKRDINDISSDFTAITATTPTECFHGRISNSVTIDNLVYFVGYNDGVTVNNNDVQVFNLDTETFIPSPTIPPTPQSGSQGCVATDNQHIFMIGGIVEDPDTRGHNVFQILDISTNKWSTSSVSYFPYGWFNQLCAVANGYFYVFGGAPSIDVSRVNTIYKYAVSSKVWSYVGELPKAVRDTWAVYDDNHNKIYVVGDDDSIHIFDVNTETVVTTVKYPNSVSLAPVFIHDNILEIIGGTLGNYMYSIEVQWTELPLLITSPPTISPTYRPTSTPTYSPTKCVDFRSFYGSNDGESVITEDYNKYINVSLWMIQYDYINDYNKSVIHSCETYGDCYHKLIQTTNVYDSYFIECFEEASCTELSVELVDHVSLIWMCNERNSCNNAHLTKKISNNINHVNDINNDIIIVCNTSNSCSDTIIDITSVALFEIHCIEAHSCDSLLIRLNTIYDIWKVICYSNNACDSLNIHSTNNDNKKLIMYRFSKSIRFYTNDINDNSFEDYLICSDEQEHRYIQYQTTKLETQNVLLMKGRNQYTESVHLPCDDITMFCERHSCKTKYSLNTSIYDIFDNNNVCYWVDFNDIYNIYCDGMCGNITYYKHRIMVTIDIIFDQYNNSNSDNSICKIHFGDLNATTKSLQKVDIIYNYALELFFGANWYQYISLAPFTTFISNSIEYLECNDSMSIKASLLVKFEIKSIFSGPELVMSYFRENSFFHNTTLGLLYEYFDATIIIKSSLVQTFVDDSFFDVLFNHYGYAMLITLLTVILSFISFVQKRTSSANNIFVKNVCCHQRYSHAIDHIKYHKIVTYGMSVLDIATTLGFVIGLFKASTVEKWNIFPGLLCLIFMFMSYAINMRKIWKLKENRVLNQFAVQWIRTSNNLKILTFFSIFSGNIYTSFGLLHSHIFGLDIFLCPLHIGDYDQLFQIQFKYITLLQNIPIFIIQSIICIIISINDTKNDNLQHSVILSMVIKFLNLFFSIFWYFLQRKYDYKLKMIKFTIYAEVSVDTDSYRNLDLEHKYDSESDVIEVANDINRLNDKKYFYNSIQREIKHYFNINMSQCNCYWMDIDVKYASHLILYACIKSDINNIIISMLSTDGQQMFSGQNWKMVHQKNMDFCMNVQTIFELDSITLKMINNSVEISDYEIQKKISDSHSDISSLLSASNVDHSIYVEMSNDK
eukprot:150036_1